MLAAGAMAVMCSACESTEQESARIGRESAAAAASSETQQLGGAPSRSVQAERVTLLSGGGRYAVAAQLRSSSAQAQREVPVLVNVIDARGRVIFSSATAGGETLLERVPLLPAHASVWWVDDHVLTSSAARTVKVRVGTGRPAAHGAGGLTAALTRVSEQPQASIVHGVLANHTGSVQHGVPVYAVALRGGRVVAAGRAVVGAVSAAGGRATPFEISMVGSAAGASVVLSAAPTAA